MSKAIELVLLDPKIVAVTGNTYAYRDMIKAIPGVQWDKPYKGKKLWQMPLESVEDACRIFPSILVSSEVRVAVHAMKDRQAKAIELKTIDTDVNLVIKGLKNPNGWKLRKYQKHGVLFIETLAAGEGCILGYDMGLGKSLTALAAYRDLKNKGLVDYCLVVCPSALRYATWKKEIAQWTDLAYQIIDGDKPEVVEWDDGVTEKLSGRGLREVQYQQYLFGTDVLVMNYELFLHDYETEVPEKEGNSKRLKAIAAKRKELKEKGLPKEEFEEAMKMFKEMLPQVAKVKLPNILPPIDGRWMVILDECHRIKNPKADTTKNLIKVCNQAGRKVLASGTPLENNIQELWSLVDFCRPGLLGSYFKFVERYMEKDFFGGIVAPKPQMMTELRTRIAPIILRKTKEEALPDLPPLTSNEYWVNMTPAQAKLYARVRDGILENLKTGEFSYLQVLAQITRLQQVCDSPALLREVTGDDSLPWESGKLLELPDIISDMDISKNQFVLFSQYSQMTDILYEFLQEKKVLRKEQLAYVKGGVKARTVLDVQEAFQAGTVRCALVTTAGNYGLDLFKGSYVLAYDQLFNPQKMNQIYSRCHRSGNTTGVMAINTLTNDSYEEKKVAVLEKKRELFKAMIDMDDEAFVKLFSVQEIIDMI